ncbi:hypothetical protein GOBAR_DD12782 [Gossypium barbadense]|nr:hypothetical protein GOBAR_DD12782 [Gossypium barbadense]
MMLNNFELGGDSEVLEVCQHHGNGNTMRAKVVDEHDSTIRYDFDHDYQPPCPNNIVNTLKAVWKAPRVPESD